MSTILAMHGVVEGRRHSIFCHRNLLDTGAFVNHLKAKNPKYIDLDRALQGEGIALTIDDATHAASTAASLARNFGHEVTLFVNPFNVERLRPYEFLQLNAVLDATDLQSFIFRGDEYDLTNVKGKKRLRKAMKFELCKYIDLDNWRTFIEEIARELNVPSIVVPAYLQTLTLDEVVELQSLGVRIENHGWTHRHMSSLSWNQVKSDIMRGKSWLLKNCHINSKAYAVPFGDHLPESRDAEEAYDVWFTLDDVLNSGFVGPNVYNRLSLVID